MRRSIAYTIAIFLTVIVALAAIPFFIPWAKYKDIAIEKVYQSSGYVLGINGKVSGGFMPLPNVRLEQVTIANAQNAAPFARMDAVEVSIALLPLLTGKVEIGSVFLDKPVVTVTKNANGSGTWEAQKPAIAQPSTMDALPTGEPEQKADVSIGTIIVKDGDVTYTDAADKKTTRVQIGILKAAFPSLNGPFSASGDLAINGLPLVIDGQVGDVTADTFGIDAAISVGDKALDLKVKGQAALKPVVNADMAFSVDIQDTTQLNTLGVSVPALLQGTKLKGQLIADQDTASLRDTVLSSPMANASVQLTVQGLQRTDKTVTAAIKFSDALNIDALLKALEKTQQKAATNTLSRLEPEASKDQKNAAFLPASLALPAGLSGSVTLDAPSLTYKNKTTGPLSAKASLSRGGTITAQTNITGLPGGGSFAANGGFTAPRLNMAYAAQINSLETVAVDWLGFAKKDLFENPNIPKNVRGNGQIAVSGTTANVTFEKLIFGQTNASGALTYTKAARPVLAVRLLADTLNIANQNAQKISATTAAVGAAKTAISPPSLPQLPFDLAFDVGLGKIQTSALSASNLKAVGRMAGQQITLQTLKAVIQGGSVSLNGVVADVSQLSGVDIKAALNTSDIRAFLSGVAPSAKLPDMVKGMVQSSVALQGDKTNMKVNASATNRGLTVSADGVLRDILNPILPGTLSVRLQHASYVEAIRLLSPSYAGKPSGALDVSANVGMETKKYSLSDLQARLGSSDLAGKVTLDLSGTKPSVTGALSSNLLALGDLMGVKGTQKTAHIYRPDGQSTLLQFVQMSSAGGAPWSNAALPTDMMHALNLDLSVKAKTLTYGSWRFDQVNLPVSLQGGNLSVSPFKGTLYGGDLTMSVNASNTAPGAPLAVKLNGAASGLDLGPFMQAMLSQSSQKLRGKGSVDINLSGAGASSASLVQSLNGGLKLTTQSLSVFGIDLEKLGQGIGAALDGNKGDWQNLLASGLTGGMSGFGLEGGTTAFKDIQHQFPISNGVLNVTDLKLDTVSDLVRTTTNGTVNFPSFRMGLNTDVYAVKASKSVLGITIQGPLNAPQKSIDSAALKVLLGSRVTKQVDKLVGSDKVQKILNKAPGLGQLLGIEEPKTEPTEPPAEPTPQQETPAPKPVEQQVIEGLFNQLGR